MSEPPRRAGIGTHHEHCVGARAVARDSPPVTGTALDNDVTRAEPVLAVVETEHDLTVEHRHEVIGEPGELSPAPTLALEPPLEPLVQHVVQVDV